MSKIPQRILYGRALVISAVIVAAAALGYWALGWKVRSSAAQTLKVAERYLRQKENARVRESLKWLLWFEPARPEALLIYGISLNADRRFTEAIEILRRIPEDSDSFDQGGIALAASLISDGQLDRAESVLRRYLARFPRSADACQRLVRLCLKRLRQREATQVLKEFYRELPEDLWVLTSLLELTAKTFNPHGYVADLEAVDRQHPSQPTVVLALARLFSLIGKPDQAKERFESALQLSPQDPLTRIWAAEFFLNSGEPEAAQKLLSLDFVDAHHDDRYWFVRCQLADQAGKVEEADFDLRKALKLRPNDEAYLLMQATLLRRQGRTEDARVAAQQASQLAEARRQLMVLFDKFDRRQPRQTQCLEIANLLERLGHSEFAAAWRRVGELVAPVEPSMTSHSPG